MKDLVGREVEVGQYICYALTAGRSANLAIYKVKEVFDDKIKAIKIDSSYGHRGESIYTLDSGAKTLYKYAKWDSKLRKTREMTEEEKFKVDNKTSTLSVPERVFILDGFTKNLFEKE